MLLFNVFLLHPKHWILHLKTMNVIPDQIHYQLIKHLPKSIKTFLCNSLTWSGKVFISHLPGRRLQLFLIQNKELTTQLLLFLFWPSTPHMISTGVSDGDDFLGGCCFGVGFLKGQSNLEKGKQWHARYT